MSSYVLSIARCSDGLDMMRPAIQRGWMQLVQQAWSVFDIEMAQILRACQSMDRLPGGNLVLRGILCSMRRAAVWYIWFPDMADGFENRRIGNGRSGSVSNCGRSRTGLISGGRKWYQSLRREKRLLQRRLKSSRPFALSANRSIASAQRCTI